jgi:uncharacterized protein YndB with AHSA1/START domain
MTLRAIGFAFGIALSGGANAEVSGAGATGFVVSFTRDVNASREALWSAITQLPSWWSSAHTWSGKASNMSLDLRAGGCWCETWGDGESVMHGQIAALRPNQLLRFHASLGPLQERATTSVLSFMPAVNQGKTQLKVTLRVVGPADVGLTELAPAVDRVIGEQVKRLAAFAETGKAD